MTWGDRRVEYLEFIRQLPVVMIPFAILAWFHYQSNLKWMQERREIAEAILAERKEWLQERRDALERQFGLNERLVTELSNARGENHAMRGRLQEHLLKQDGFMMRVEKALSAVERFFEGRTGGKDG